MFRNWCNKQIREEVLKMDFIADLQELTKLDKILSTLKRLEAEIGHVMSAISDFAEKQNAFNDAQDTAITDLQGDVKSLNDQIEALVDSQGSVSPEDQASLDALVARGQAITDKLQALDALTPPVVPPTT